MIDNFKLIENILTFESEDDFYHLQILKRKKENPTIGSNSVVIKSYYITSVEYLKMREDEIKVLCDHHNARAYINLNPRSFESIAFHALKKITDIIMNKDYKSARKAYESVCGTYGTGRNKTWVIDIDGDDATDVAKKVIADINTCKPDGDKFITSVPTKNGMHLITKPFDLSNFQKISTSDISIHKNNPTLLYIP